MCEVLGWNLTCTECQKSEKRPSLKIVSLTAHGVLLWPDMTLRHRPVRQHISFTVWSPLRQDTDMGGSVLELQSQVCSYSPAVVHEYLLRRRKKFSVGTESRSYRRTRRRFKLAVYGGAVFNHIRFHPLLRIPGHVVQTLSFTIESSDAEQHP